MKRTPLLSLLPLFALALGARAATVLPDRPAVVMAQNGSAWQPVVDVDAMAPVVAVDKSGATQKLAPTAHLVLTVGGKFGPGFVTVKDTDPDETAAKDPDAYGQAMSGASSTVIFGTTLNSDTDLSNVFVALYFEQPSSGPDKPPSVAVVIRPVGALSAGKDFRLKSPLPSLEKIPNAEWRVLVFSGPLEVHSTGMADVLPSYFDRVEHFSLARDIAARAAKGADAKLEVFRRVPLNLPDAVQAKYHGQTVSVDLGIAEDGSVSSLEPVNQRDPDLKDALQKGLGLWLFLPAVKGGKTTASHVVIPLKM
jgi:hypothetical protein